MPAQTVAGAPAPAVTGTRTAPGEPRDAGTADGHFGRQLDVARQSHRQPHKDVDAYSASRAEAKRDADVQAAIAAPLETSEETAALTPGFSSVIKRVLGGADAAAGSDTDAADHVPADSVPQGVFALLAPLLGAVSATPVAAGGVVGSRTLAASALAIGSAAGAAADAARASALLKLSAADTQPANATPAGLVGHPVGLSVLLDGIRPPAADDASTPAASAAGIGAAPVPLSTAAGAGVPIVVVATPVGTPGFGQEFGRQITWLATQDLKQARVGLHPEELGQMDLKISVTDGRVDVAFSVQHPGAAQAVQQSLPQLDQMLAQQGLSLGHTEVGQHGSDGSSSYRHGAGAAEADDGGEPHALTALTTVRSSSLLDAFA
jgi:flagellar hook-length control protein FliK